jgi:hypothetical protein
MERQLRTFITLIILLIAGSVNAQSYFLEGLFLDPTIEKEKLLFKPLNSLEEIKATIDSYTINLSEVRLANIQAGSAVLLNANGELPICKLEYSLTSKDFEAYTYLMRTRPDDSVAFLVIPGTGSNQSSAIYRADSTNYHGEIINRLKDFGDVFVFLKKNEDALALHDGYGKLSKQALMSSLINNGGSYGALYLADGIAWIKYLKKQFKRVFVLGLSQGGEAAFLLSLMAEPYACVSSSGYSVLWSEMYPSDLDGLQMFGRNSRFSLDSIKATINHQPTKYLLTYGTQDIQTYTMLEEAFSHPTCNEFADLPNVRCSIGDHGHVFPIHEIVKFINDGVPPKPFIISESDTITMTQGTPLTLTAEDQLTDIFRWYKNGEYTGIDSTSIEVESDGIFYVVGSNEFGETQSSPVVATFRPDVRLSADSIEFVSAGSTLKITAVYFPGNKYQWYKLNVPISTGHTIDVTEPGRFHVEILTEAGIQGSSRDVTVVFQENIKVDEDNQGRLSIKVFLDGDFSGPASITIYDGSGRKIKESVFEKQEKYHFENFDLSSFEKGMYIVNLQGKNFFEQKKFIKIN